jgi:hypothetical protein
VLDKPKTCVTRPKPHLELHAQFLAFCRYYGCEPDPAWPYHPERKGKTERSLRDLEEEGVLGTTASTPSNGTTGPTEARPLAPGSTSTGSRQGPSATRRRWCCWHARTCRSMQRGLRVRPRALLLCDASGRFRPTWIRDAAWLWRFALNGTPRDSCATSFTLLKTARQRRVAHSTFLIAQFVFLVTTG